MWRILAVALAVSTASAEPVKRGARAPCTPAGGVLLEIDQRATGKRTTAATVLFANGAWRSKTFDTDGKLADTEQGCLGPDVRDGIAAAVFVKPSVVSARIASRCNSPTWGHFPNRTRPCPCAGARALVPVRGGPLVLRGAEGRGSRPSRAARRRRDPRECGKPASRCTPRRGASRVR